VRGKGKKKKKGDLDFRQLVHEKKKRIDRTEQLITSTRRRGKERRRKIANTERS